MEVVDLNNIFQGDEYVLKVIVFVSLFSASLVALHRFFLASFSGYYFLRYSLAEKKFGFLSSLSEGDELGKDLTRCLKKGFLRDRVFGANLPLVVSDILIEIYKAGFFSISEVKDVKELVKVSDCGKPQISMSGIWYRFFWWASFICSLIFILCLSVWVAYFSSALVFQHGPFFGSIIAIGLSFPLLLIIKVAGTPVRASRLVKRNQKLLEKHIEIV